MSSQIAVMADQDTVTGFRLGGIKKGYPVQNMEEADKTLRELVKKDFSIIRSTIDKFTKTSALPMIIEIPDKTGSIRRESDPMSELIKRVIGVEMVK